MGVSGPSHTSTENNTKKTHGDISINVRPERKGDASLAAVGGAEKIQNQIESESTASTSSSYCFLSSYF
jgi:hypothetical protein